MGPRVSSLEAKCRLGWGRREEERCLRGGGLGCCVNSNGSLAIRMCQPMLSLFFVKSLDEAILISRPLVRSLWVRGVLAVLVLRTDMSFIALAVSEPGIDSITVGPVSIGAPRIITVFAIMFLIAS